MKLSRIIIAIASIAIASSTLAAIDKSMVVSAGSLTGDYHPMIKNVVDVCHLGDQVEVLESGGSLDNNVNIFGDPPKATAGVFQYDFALYMRDRDPKWMNNMVVVQRLHDEFLQIFTLNKVIESGGVDMSWAGIGRVGGATTILKDFNSLKGQTVFAWGGSYYSANVLSDKFGLGLKVVDLSGTKVDGKGGYTKVDKAANPQQVAAMLVMQGKGSAVITVGSPSLKWLTTENGYGKQWKLLPVASDDAAKVGGVYGLKRVNYLQLSGGEAQTLTIPALLMTRGYQSETRVVPILAVQKCIREKITTLRDEGNVNWLTVDPKATFDGWKAFEVPAELKNLVNQPVAPPASADKPATKPTKK